MCIRDRAVAVAVAVAVAAAATATTATAWYQQHGTIAIVRENPHRVPPVVGPAEAGIALYARAVHLAPAAVPGDVSALEHVTADPFHKERKRKSEAGGGGEGGKGKEISRTDKRSKAFAHRTAQNSEHYRPTASTMRKRHQNTQKDRKMRKNRPKQKTEKKKRKKAAS